MSKTSKRRKEDYAKVTENLGNVKWGVRDALKGDGDTYEEKVCLSDEMRLHMDKMEVPSEKADKAR